MPTTDEARQRKTRENRLRVAAERQGLRLSKVRRMDPRALDYGHYHLIRDGEQVLDAANLDAVEQYLDGTTPGRGLAALIPSK